MKSQSNENSSGTTSANSIEGCNTLKDTNNSGNGNAADGDNGDGKKEDGSATSSSGSGIGGIGGSGGGDDGGDGGENDVGAAGTNRTSSIGTNNAGERKRLKPGILRLDISKPRRSSGGSVEFRTQPQLLGEDVTSPSGTTSPHQLSVTWASQCDINDPGSLTKPMQNCLELTNDKGRRATDEKSNELTTDPSTPLDPSGGTRQSENEDDEEDYSISVSAIMQRRASIRGNRRRSSRRSRRASSPMDHVLETISQSGERRRSSVYTTSSGDTAISVDDGTNQESSQEQIYENIRLHKEVIQSVKLQPWSIRKKLKLVRQAKTYVARHEGALQERFAMSRSTRDLWARFKILMAARWRHWKREITSFLTVLIPWELRIKEIESHFGSGVASYFTFLRWLLWVNIMIGIPLVAFVIAPELLSTHPHETDPRKNMTERELKIAGNIVTIWEFEGYLKYSPLFYGYYSSISGAVRSGYNLPLAYFLTAVAVYVYSFVATLRKMAENSRTSKLSSKDDECVFSWKLFTGWDFMIGHAETAHNRVASVVVGFKEALLEEAEKKKDKRNWRIILQRILVNILVMGLLAASGYTVVSAVDRSETVGPNASWFRRNEVNVIMTLLSFFLPMIFDALGLFENWHPRQQLRLQLARIMILNLLNLYSLMFSFIYKITGKDESLQHLKEVDKYARLEKTRLQQEIENLKFFLTTITSSTAIFSTRDFTSDITDFMELSTTELPPTNATNSNPMIITNFITDLTTASIQNLTQCFTIPVNCSRIKLNRTLTTSFVLLNLSTTMLPEMQTTNEFSTINLNPTTELYSTDFTFDYNETNINTTLNFDLNATTASTFDSTISTIFSTITTPIYDENDSKLNDTYFEYADYFDNFKVSEEEIENSSQENQFNGNSVLLKRIIRNVAIFEDFDEPQKNSTTLMTNANQMPNMHKNDSNRNTNDNQSSTEAVTNLVSDEITNSPNNERKILTTTTLIPINSSRMDDEEYDDGHEDDRQFAHFLYENQMNSKIPTNSPTSNENDPTNDDSPDYYVTNLYDILNEANEDDIEENENNCTVTRCITIPFNIYTTTEPSNTNPTEMTTSKNQLALPTQSAQLNQLELLQDELKNATDLIDAVRRNLTSMCWETSLGQELAKVIVFDTILSIAAPLIIDFLRALFVRYMNNHWCWDMEKTFPQYGDFKIAESILNLVYNQGQVWMGIFFSPGLVIINLVKLIILMYLRSWIVLTCNVPHEVVFKASKSNNFYLSLLLTMLFLCVLPVGYAIVWIRPSWHCGPFSDYNRISEFFTNTTRDALPEDLRKPLEYMTSSSTVIPLLLLLTLIIYYLVSLTGALREANQDLRTQLQKEREEERKKIFKIPENKPTETSVLTSRWKKVLEASSPVSPTGPGNALMDLDESKNQARKELLARIMKKALRKGSATSEEDSIIQKGNNEDDTDTEHHDSLPHDEEGKEKVFRLSKLHGRRGRKASLVDIVKMAKIEGAKEKEFHPMGRFKVNRTVDHDPDINSRIVSERRQSLLKKQEKLLEKSLPEDQASLNDLNSNYEIVNEKNVEAEKKAKRKLPSTPAEPAIFKFDENSVNVQKSPIPQSETNTPKLEKQSGFSKQGRKKIGSFLALVKEAVNKKGNEHDAVDNDQSISATSSPNLSEADKKFIAQKPIATEEYDAPGPLTPPIRSDSQSKRKIDRPLPMRQDSQTSVWSDNIPTITISKTNSEENILDFANRKKNINSDDSTSESISKKKTDIKEENH